MAVEYIVQVKKPGSYDDIETWVIDGLMAQGERYIFVFPSIEEAEEHVKKQGYKSGDYRILANPHR